jgi:MFS family permease
MLSTSPRRFEGERSLLAGMAIDAVGNGMYIPFSLIFFRHVTGLPLAVIGLVLTGTGLASMALLPWIGAVTDRLGARRMQLALYLVRALGFGAYPFAHSLPAFCAVALVTSVATQGFPAVQQARIGELASGTDLERINAVARSLANAGLGAGSLLAALLVSHAGDGGYTIAAWLNGASFLIAALLARRVPAGAGAVATGRRPAGGAGYRQVLDDRPFLGLTSANLLIALGYSALAVLLPVYATSALHASGSITGLAFAVNTVICAVFGIPAGRLVRRFATRNRAAAAGAVLFAVGFLAQALLVPAAGRWIAAGLLGAVVVCTLGEVIHNPAASALATTTAPAALRGRYLATYQLSWSLSKAIAPSLFTGLLAVNTRLPWLLLAAGVLLGAAMLLTLERRLPAEAVRPRDLVTAA